jgi:transcriptional regulator with XRE-family HTH domain
LKQDSQQKISLIQLIKKKWQTSGLNKAELARQIGISPVLLTRLFEGDQSQIKIEDFLKILIYFDLLKIDPKVSEPIPDYGIPNKNTKFRDYNRILGAIDTFPSEFKFKIYSDLMGEMLKLRTILSEKDKEIVSEGIQTIMKLIKIITDKHEYIK